MSNRYRKSDNFQTKLNKRLGKYGDSEFESVLHITCWLGHSLADLVKPESGELCTLRSLWRVGNVFPKNPSKHDERLAAQELLEQREYFEHLKTSLPILVENYPNFESWQTQQSNEAPKSQLLARITPDGKALTWACFSCFKSGISGTTSRAKPQRHTGTVKLWPLVAITAGLAPGEQETVIGNTTTAKRLAETKYNSLAQTQQSKTQQLLNVLAEQATELEVFEAWEKENFVISGMSRKDKRKRYRR